MKKNTAYTIGSLIILLICAFCFVVLPAFTGSGNQQQDIPVFGKYNGKEIKYVQDSDFASYVSQYGQMYQMYGQQLDSSAYFYIYNSAFNATVRDYAYTEAVEKSGYTVPQNVVNRNLVSYFTDANGNYSSKLYKQTDDSTKEELSNSTRKYLTVSRFSDDNFGSTSSYIGSNSLYGLKTPAAELDFLTSYNSDKRGFSLAAFNMSNYPDEEKVKFGNANKAKFNKYNMSVITVEDKATAEKVAKRIEAGEITFEDAVSEYSSKSYSDTEGKMNSSYQYQIENMLENAADLATVASVAENAISTPVQTKTGYSLFKNNGPVTTPDFTDSNVLSIVMAYIRSYENSLVEDYYIAKANDLVNEAKKGNFEELCDADETIEYAEITPFALNYGNVSIANSLDTSMNVLGNADKNEDFLKTCFSMKLNEFSKPMVMNNCVVVLQYTTEATNSEYDTAINATTLVDFDEESAQDVILASDKLENNFINVYFESMMR